jgi:acyl-coenzyme A thioesterase PaaI-like protein
MTVGVHQFESPLSPDAVPEHFMGIRDIELHDGAATAVVATGPWLTWDGRDVTPASLGVLFDNILAYPMINGASADTSLVSVQISIDVLSQISADAGPLSARGTLLVRDGHTAFATGEVRNPDGALVAVGTQRGRYIRHVDPPAYDNPSIATRTGTSTLMDLVWPGGDVPRLGDDGRLAIRVVPGLANHVDNMHGGISLLVAEWCAIAAARAAGSALAPASIRIFYARPMPVGSVATFETSVLHAGRTSAEVEVVGRTAAGKCGVAASVTLY